MHRRQHNQKFSALACGTFQHVVQVASQETRLETLPCHLASPEGFLMLEFVYEF